MNRERNYPLPFEKTNRTSGLGIAPAPCAPRKMLEIPVGMTVGQCARCPYCGEYHTAVALNERARIV